MDARGDEFTGSVYGAVALGNITVAHTHEAIDALRDERPDLLKGEVSRLVRQLDGGGKVGLLRMLEIRMEDVVRGGGGRAWLADFGNAAYEKALPHIERLQFAIANHLGRHCVENINTFAKVIVAQSLACEAAAYVERRQKMMRGLVVTTWRKERMSVPFMLCLLSARPIEKALTRLAHALIEPNSKGDIDLFTDRAILDGCKAVVNVLGDVKTWEYARDKADELAVNDTDD